jgi:hypothetical protein
MFSGTSPATVRAFIFSRISAKTASSLHGVVDAGTARRCRSSNGGR